MGATHTINSIKTDPFMRIKEELNGDFLDVFIDNTGIPSIIEKGYEIIHSKGKVVLVGVPKAGAKSSVTLPLHFGKQLIGSHGGSSKPQHDIPDPEST